MACNAIYSCKRTCYVSVKVSHTHTQMFWSIHILSTGKDEPGVTNNITVFWFSEASSSSFFYLYYYYEQQMIVDWVHFIHICIHHRRTYPCSTDIRIWSEQQQKKKTEKKETRKQLKHQNPPNAFAPVCHSEHSFTFYCWKHFYSELLLSPLLPLCPA